MKRKKLSFCWHFKKIQRSLKKEYKDEFFRFLCNRLTCQHSCNDHFLTLHSIRSSYMIQLKNITCHTVYSQRQQKPVPPCAFHQESVACFHLSTMGDNTMIVQLTAQRRDHGVPQRPISLETVNGNTVNVSGLLLSFLINRLCTSLMIYSLSTQNWLFGLY